ncbi:hypothetical protein IGB42_00374 [Andreprevotia sp. IGB-42]|uniref:DUF3540 domain-containing protein n=1 Tax=Andreprevotia sp. IGB-42 TaxID=2497473 RepID=UPI001359AF28|nr:DUF3540 domain-containing protein [Andreprevotia sp. IGB-42]KAF0815293.1 hypothetical protein IGB42_00374 [Andreprevotia sp. IGB-42]
MHTYRQSIQTQSPAVPAWHESSVAVALGEGRYLLEDGRMAAQAVSCVIEAAVGDRVLVAGCGDGNAYIVHILARPQLADATLSVPGASRLQIQQATLDLASTGDISLQTLKDVKISAGAGAIRLTAQDLFQNVNGSVVENAHHFIGQAEHYLLEVKQLLRQHGQQVIVTAESDVKVDAERISMG